MPDTDQAHVERFLGPRDHPHVQPHIKLIAAALAIQQAADRDPVIRETVAEAHTWVAQPLPAGTSEADRSTLIAVGYLRAQTALAHPDALTKLREQLQQPAALRDRVRAQLATAGPQFKSELLREAKARAQTDRIFARQLGSVAEDLREVGGQVGAIHQAPTREGRAALEAVGCTIFGTNAPLSYCIIGAAIIIGLAIFGK